MKHTAANSLGAVILLAMFGCADNPAATPDEKQSLVVLGLTELTGGPIKGSVPCQDKEGRALLDDSCLPDASTLARSVLNCGPVQVSIDIGSTHESYVYFPSDPSKDFDTVKCVQRRVGFRFRAGTSSVLPSSLDFNPDDRLFKSLHSSDTP